MYSNTPAAVGERPYGAPDSRMVMSCVGGEVLTSILFADDSPAVRRAIRAVLTAQLGEEIVYIEADGGEEALSKAVAFQPDIVVLDIAMPGLNGLETARYIKQRCPKSAVLAISSYDLEPVIPRVALGISGFVRKEMMSSELSPAIQALLEGKTYFTRPLDPTTRTAATSVTLT